MTRIYNDDGSYYYESKPPVIKATINELLATQARQLDHYCEGLSEAAAAELRRRIKLRTGVYPRPEIEIEVAYAQIPRGGDIEAERALILQEFQDMDPLDALMGKTPTPSQQAVARDGVAAHRKLRRFMSEAQWKAVRDLLTGEEHEFFQQKMADLAATIDSMPNTGDRRSSETVYHLHYFKGSADWYISLLDEGAEGDTPAEFMSQCFGYADLFGGQGTGELGYISIPEIVANGAELDFHFIPGPLPWEEGDQECSDCGAKLNDLLICPDGAEVCPDCQHKH